ncbi:hypothetical protein CEXT_203741 [Caerostris extrusa]|uniref:Uncharacterized protein n=1 Tax=Caerostris extrusa TaxID=172846 RepID=A0AAV4NYW4_CAEEX|nr:hypothetical protein CEXT_203741 [Caerostris extrusa]
MEAAEDEWWRRMERDATMDYSVRESAPGASNPELMETTCAIQSERLASPTFPEKQSNLSDKEHCARITTVIKKKDIAHNLYDAYAAALTGYSPDDDDLKELKIHHDDLQLAMRERNAAHLNNHEHDNDGFYYALKRLIAKVNCAKNTQHLVETKNSFDKLIVDEQEEQDSNSTPIVKKMPPIMVKPTENLKNYACQI